MEESKSQIPDIREMEKSEIKALSPEDFEKSMTKQQWDRALDELVEYDYRSFLERYALYMARAQMLEIYLKQDLEQKFGVGEAALERMTLGSIRYWFRDNPQVSIHPSFDVSLSTLIDQRNSMAHDFLFTGAAYRSIVGKEGLRLHARDLGKWSLGLELTFQGYLMLKETDLLYFDPRSGKAL